MMPNKLAENCVKDSVLFECECGGNHYLEVSLIQENNPEDSMLFISLIDRPIGMLNYLKSTWKRGRSYISEIQLNDDDIRALRNKLDEYLGEKGE